MRQAMAQTNMHNANNILTYKLAHTCPCSSVTVYVQGINNKRAFTKPYRAKGRGLRLHLKEAMLQLALDTKS